MSAPLQKVKPIAGEEFRFHAASDTFGAYPYLVDLEEQLGRGQCECPDWVCNRHKQMKEGETNPVLTACKHVKRCWIFWARMELARIGGDDMSLLVNSATNKALMLWAVKRLEKLFKEKRRNERKAKQ